MRTIELQWDDAKWNREVAEGLVRDILLGLKEKTRPRPDKWMVRGPVIADEGDPDPNAITFEPMTRRLVSLL